MTTPLQRWNEADGLTARKEILPCNGSTVWAERLAAQRPFKTEVDLLRASDLVWAQLTLAQRQEAFDSHPRLGELQAKAATSESLRQSAGEQESLGDDEGLKFALAQRNRAYEAKFGHIFLLCASGKTTSVVLSVLNERLGNDPETELHEIVEQQRRITQLRLRKWLGLPLAACEAV